MTEVLRSQTTSKLQSIHSDRSLSWSDHTGNVYMFFHRPMRKVCIFILIQEMCERLAYYGLTPCLQLFLKDYLGYTDTQADSYIAIFNGLLYVTPLLSAVIADTIVEVYKTIIIFSLIYMFGIGLLCISSISVISEPWMIHLSLMVFMVIGAGGIKSCVNVFGGQQFHPDAHKNEITTYYTYFYATINVGALVGGIICPILVQEVSFFSSFLVPFIAFVIATCVFIIGTPRYVRMKPQGSQVVAVCKVLAYSVRHLSVAKCKKSNGGPFEDQLIHDAVSLFRLFPIFVLGIPFNVAYNLMTTAWLTQGSKMDTWVFGWNMQPALMQNVDAISVILCSFLVDGFVYPFLRKRGWMLSVMWRFAVGSLLCAVSLLCSYLIELWVMKEPLFTVSIWAQIPQFALMAAGEIFLVSTSYEVAFTYAPDQLKTVASAVNLLFFAVANFIAAALFSACSPWMPNFDKTDPSTWTAVSHYDYFYLVLIGLCILGAIGAALMVPYYNKIMRERDEAPKRTATSAPSTPTIAPASEEPAALVSQPEVVEI